MDADLDVAEQDEQRVTLLLDDLSTHISGLQHWRRAYLQLMTDYNTLTTEKATVEESLRVAQLELARIQSTERKMLCLVDGDGAIFSRALIAKGREGGLQAARTLITAIRNYARDAVDYHLLIYCFLRKSGLANALGSAGKDLGEFIGGFNDLSGSRNRTFMVDVGAGKENADSRIKELLRDGAQSPLTTRIFLAVCHDNGYVSDLNSLITESVHHKIVLLPTYTDIAEGIQRLNFPMLRIPGLFRAERLERRVSNASVLSTSSSPPPSFRTAAESLPSIRSMDRDDILPSMSSQADSVDEVKRVADVLGLTVGSAAPPAYTPPSAPRNVRNLCINHHMFAGCRLGTACRKVHGESLSPAERGEMKALAKQMLCKQGDKCKRGAQCSFGHKCPKGAGCDALKKDNAATEELKCTQDK